MSSATGGRNGVPPPTTTGLRNMLSSSTRPSSIAADPDVLISCFERGAGLLGHRPRSEPGVALDAVERAAEDNLRDRAPGVGERGVELAVAHRRIRFPHQHRLVEPAA